MTHNIYFIIFKAQKSFEMKHESLEDLEYLLRSAKAPRRARGDDKREKEVERIIKEFIAKQKELQTNKVVPK